MKVFKKYAGVSGNGRIDLKEDNKYSLCRVSRWLPIHHIEEATKKEKEEMNIDTGDCDFIRFRGVAIPLNSLMATGTMENPSVVAYKDHGKLNYISAFCYFDIFHTFYIEIDEKAEKARFYTDCE